MSLNVQRDGFDIPSLTVPHDLGRISDNEALSIAESILTALQEHGEVHVDVSALSRECRMALQLALDHLLDHFAEGA